jgi:glycosyltransferase involved in cell wall biosynthesis
VVIPLGNAFDGKAMPQRESALIFAIKNFYLNHSGIEIIIVCQNVNPSFLEKNGIIIDDDMIKVIVVNYPIFNKGWCINIGVRAASSAFVCIAESDMYSYEAHLLRVVQWMKLKNLKWGFAWNALIYTTEQQRDRIMSNLPSEGEMNVVSPKAGLSEGGLVMFERAFFLSIGGCNEWFEELGGPDNELAFRARVASNTYEAFFQVVVHLWHPKCRVKTSETRKKNIQLYRSTVRHAKEFNEMLFTQTIGKPFAPLASHISFKKAWEFWTKHKNGV